MISWSRNDLVANVDAVQYTIGLLIPEGSLLLSAPEVEPRLESYDPAKLSWVWSAPEPWLDELQKELEALVEAAGAAPGPGAAGDTFEEVDGRVRDYVSLHGVRAPP